MSDDAWWLGNSALSRSSVCFSAIDDGNDRALSDARVSPSAGTATAPSATTAITSVRTG